MSNIDIHEIFCVQSSFFKIYNFLILSFRWTSVNLVLKLKCLCLTLQFTREDLKVWWISSFRLIHLTFLEIFSFVSKRRNALHGSIQFHCQIHWYWLHFIGPVKTRTYGRPSLPKLMNFRKLQTSVHPPPNITKWLDMAKCD